MILSWYSPGILMVLSWYSHGTLMVLSPHQAWTLDSGDSIDHSNAMFRKKDKEEKVKLAIPHHTAPLRR